MSDDGELLRSYVEQNSEQAFAELVNRHLGLVYHAALRQTGGNAHRAQDVAQTVFVDLARKAKSLTHHPVLSGWLYTSTRYAASKVARSEQRRQAREEGAQLMNELTAHSSSSADWNQLRPIIDDALHALNERDREAVLLRFFEGKPFAEVGAKLAVSEDAARVRVDRALDKLRALLSRRGVTSTSAALATLLANEALAVAPAGLALKITGVALAGAAATAGATAVATFIGMTKLQVGFAAVLVAAGGTVIVQQQQAQGDVRAQIAELRQQQDQLIHSIRANDIAAQSLQEGPRIQPELTDLSKLRAEIKELQEKKEEGESYKANLAQIARQRETRRRAAFSNPNLKPEEQPFGPILGPSDLDVRPLPTTMVEPTLSKEQAAAFTGQDLKATAHFIVDQTGIPRNITVTDANNPEFVAAVEKAIPQWVFSPGQVNGRAVSTRLSVPFRINKKNATAGRTAAPAGSGP